MLLCLASAAPLTACASALDLGTNAHPTADDGGDASFSTADEDSGNKSRPIGDAQDGGDVSDGGDARVDADVDAGKQVFITRARYRGGFGGLTGGDFRCQSSATAAGLAGTFKAWLSDATADAADRFTSDGPWLEVGSGKLVFPSRAGLRGYPMVPLRNDERGQPAGDDWWTGTLANGVKAPRNCQGWTTDDVNELGLIGERISDVDPPGQEWTEWAHSVCSDSRALLCLED